MIFQYSLVRNAKETCAFPLHPLAILRRSAIPAQGVGTRFFVKRCTTKLDSLRLAQSVGSRVLGKSQISELGPVRHQHKV